MSNEESSSTKTGWEHSSWVSMLGKWAWVVGLVSGIVLVIWGIIVVATLAIIPFGFLAMGPAIWYIISGIIAILISFAIIKPKVSNKCDQKDWDHFYNWVLKLGNFRFPFVLFWGIILEIFGLWWGGIPVIIVAIMLIFLGPKKYKWSE